MANDIIANAQAAANTPANGAPAPEQSQQQQTSAAQRVTELNQPGDQGIFSRDQVKKKEGMVALKAALAAQESDEEKATRSSLTVAERREEFGVEPPTLPKSYMAEYDADWAPWETDLFDVTTAAAASWRPASMGRSSGSTASAERGSPGVLTTATSPEDGELLDA